MGAYSDDGPKQKGGLIRDLLVTNRVLVLARHRREFSKTRETCSGSSRTIGAGRNSSTSVVAETPCSTLYWPRLRSSPTS